MAESVDALVSNTSGATRAGSTPALGTKSALKVFTFKALFFLTLNVDYTLKRKCMMSPSCTT